MSWMSGVIVLKYTAKNFHIRKLLLFEQLRLKTHLMYTLCQCECLDAVLYIAFIVLFRDS